MKKSLKFFLIIPMFLFACLFYFACNEPMVDNISLSLLNYEMSSGVYYIKQTKNKIELNANINPDSFSLDNLEISSSDTSIVSIYNNRYLVIRGSGNVSVTAKYQNSNGEIKKDIIDLCILPSSDEMNFALDKYETTYSGTSIQNNYLVEQDDLSGDYTYSYYSIDSGEEVETIINAGNYYITCNYLEESCSSFLNVKKAQINIQLQNYQINYGDDLPEGIFNENNLPSNILNQEGGIVVNGVGNDSSASIGRYILTSTVQKNSNVGNYELSAKFVLSENYLSNYDKNPNIQKGNINILPKRVVLSVRDQEISYGENIIAKNIDLYDYDAYLNNLNSIEGLTPLSNDTTNYKENVYLESPVFKSGNQVVDVINATYLNATDENYYDLCYEKIRVLNGNLSILKIFNGKLIINPREVVINPKINQSKVYSEDDPISLNYNIISGNFLRNDNLNPFLKIDYNDAEYGENNYLAPAGKYFYKIDNSANTNYNITLGQESANDGDRNNDGKIRFEVKACEIVLSFEDYTGFYKLPSNHEGIENPVHSASYYSFVSTGIEPDLKLNLQSVKVNDVEIINNPVNALRAHHLSQDFNETGKICLKTGGSFSCSLGLSRNSSSDCFLSYNVSISGSYFYDVDSDSNYIFSCNTSTVDLNKIEIVLVPKMSPQFVSKIYDGTGNLNYQLGADCNFVGNIEDDLSIEDIVEDPFSLVTLKNKNDKFVYKNNDSIKSEVGEFRNCGQYQLFLTNNIRYKEGREYYDIKIDDSQEYYYTINKYTALVYPLENQSKIYGETDPNILQYRLSENLPDSPLVLEGNLGRESGEDVGTYNYSIGSLRHDNYDLKLINDVDPNFSQATFKITKRIVSVTPRSYVSIYGENYPTTFGYSYEIIGNYDLNILQLPIFSGKFSIDGAKVGNYYPVKTDNFGNEIGYSILQNTFACDSNYQIDFVNTSTYKILKRNCVLNITSQQKSNESEIITSFDLDNAYYDVSNKISGTTTILSVNLEDKDSYYGVSSFNLRLFDNGIDVSTSYDVVLGRDIVYNIDVTIINLAIVDAATQLSSMIEKQYIGTEYLSQFVVISQTEGFEVDNNLSNFYFSYANGEIDNASPINAGSYVVSINEESEFEIVIKNNRHICDENCEENCEDKDIVFTNFDDVVENCIICISNFGYLDITKANINYVNSELGFERNLIYGDTVLPSDIKTTNSEGYPIFTSVLGDSLLLKNYSIDGEVFNFNYSKSNYSLNHFEANKSYSINVTIQVVEEDGSIDGNYNPCSINVPLYVDPKPINIIDSKFLINRQETSSVRYDGLSKVANLVLTILNSDEVNYAVTYTYYKLKTEYASGESGVFKYYIYNKSLGTPNIASGYSTASYSKLSKIDSLGLMNANGEELLIINEQYCASVQSHDVVAPVNAGIYICLATAEAQANYAFPAESTYESNISFAFAYEVKKSGNIAVTNWKKKFYYTTQFDFSKQSTLPFSFDMNPDFKDEVNYNLEGKVNWPSNNIPNVGNYKVSISLDHDNYYYKSTFDFEIEKLAVDFVFPTLKTYVYIGEGQSVTSFLSNIKIIERDKDGKADKSYYYVKENDNCAEITFEYYDSFNNKLDEAPYAVGKDYKVVATYGNPDSGTSNRYGRGEFTYSIIKKAYTGSVIFQNKTVTYDPKATEESFYNSIILDMFAITLDSAQYDIKFYNDDFSPSQKLGVETGDNWLEDVNDVGEHTLRVVVEFEDGITADYEKTAILKVNKYSLKQSDFSFTLRSDTSSSTVPTITYTGFEVYDSLIYTTEDNEEVDLDPSLNEIKISNGKPFDTKINKDLNNVKLYDKFSHLVFSLTYKYYIFSSEIGEYEEIGYVPCEPNLKYKVEYVFSEDATNYSTSTLTLKSQEFIINKVDTLYVKVNNWIVTYDGLDFASRFNYNERMVVRNSQYVDENKTNMKIAIIMGSTISYNYEDGVHFYVNFTEIPNYSVYNAGEYDFYISLLNYSEYNISKYFNKININGSEFDVVNLLSNTNLTYAYDKLWQGKLTVNKADSRYNNWQSAFEFEYEEEGTNPVRYESNVLYVNKLTRLNNKSDCNVIISGYKNGSNRAIVTIEPGNDFSFNTTDLDGFESLSIYVDEDLNHYASNSIDLVIEKVNSRYNKSNFGDALGITLSDSSVISAEFDNDSQAIKVQKGSVLNNKSNYQICILAYQGASSDEIIIFAQGNYDLTTNSIYDNYDRFEAYVKGNDVYSDSEKVNLIFIDPPVIE